MRKCMGLVVSAVVLLGCMVGALNSSRTPTDVHVTPPAPKLTPRLAEFSGVWESIDGRPRKIVVENIHETSAVIVHSRADQPAGERNGWQERLPAYVLRDGTIRWGYPERFTLRLTEAGAVLEREGVGAPERIRLRKVPTPAPQVTVAQTSASPPDGPPLRAKDAK